ncbi:MAG: ABC transporter ATP-binding protein [Defluviitoga tunisiensis]|jgi:ABC-2 type transport system ATP-binding protein|uniref:ABC-type multidrug transport system, ATPase component n=1 Tax=Defluviitoga tunisiensis TaxID=1006576 RepID=A0A0C7NI80_DEFTU|nr:ABC transporter ATP-binding protein [Defluviitoga tunisiensis]MDD3601421.1 ABC transporter ATP-binding protein [Defluviitoga tunisiensis]CEP77676.1 ABC-type multidrug transport system, ATPase component [Defluviitoga tunisiensis]HHV01603.1 ABC transporter ATP-binding protein [Defluviitoga tunisiensis]
MKIFEGVNEAVSFEKVTKRFGNTIAVNNVDLRINRGEIFGLIGPNGAGKSTIMKMISTLLTPTFGEVRVFGQDLYKNKQTLRKYISLVSDYSVLEEDLTPYENLKLFATVADVENAEEKIDNFLLSFDLDKHERKLTKNLSSGNKQKLNIARALLKSPEILLLDEPTNAIDVESSRFIRRFILNENITKGTTIIISSHYLWEIEQLATSVGIIVDGKIVIKDSIDKLYERFDTKINIFELTIKKDDYQSVLEKVKSLPNITAIKPVSDEKIIVETKDPNFSLNELEVSQIKLRPTLEDIYSYIIENSNNLGID